jgi:hypothetical protein
MEYLMSEFKPIAPKPLSEAHSKTKFTIKSNIINSTFQKAEKLKGGKADFKPDEDFDPEQLKAGIKVEREHTKDEAAAKEVAKDHLTEFSDYYKRLNKMEDKAKKDMKKSFSRANTLIKSMKESCEDKEDSIDEEDMDIKKKFESKKQQKYMYAAAERGDIPKKVVEEFSDKTKDFSKLPETKKSISNIVKALKASAIAGLSRRERLNAAYQAGMVVGRNKYFEVEPISLSDSLEIGISEDKLRPDYEPPVVPIRRIETSFAIPPKKCGDHIYRIAKAGPQESKPYWRR